MEFNRAIGDFSEDELREYACEHVLYEITHFVRAVQAIEAARAGQFPMNFAVEVFALHVRNLLDFFAPRNTRKTDACARNFYEGWEEPVLDPYLREARWMADKHIAHLTTDRVIDMNLKTWAVEPIVYSLLPIIERFANGANFVCESFRKQVAERVAELPSPRDRTELPSEPDPAPGSRCL
jgi:hypothetical protein